MIAIHAGETLKEVLEDRGITQYELAMKIDVQESYINDVVNGQRSISVALAEKLENGLGIDKSFWINLQSIYDEKLNRMG